LVLPLFGALRLARVGVVGADKHASAADHRSAVRDRAELERPLDVLELPLRATPFCRQILVDEVDHVAAGGAAEHRRVAHGATLALRHEQLAAIGLAAFRALAVTLLRDGAGIFGRLLARVLPRAAGEAEAHRQNAREPSWP